MVLKTWLKIVELSGVSSISFNHPAGNRSAFARAYERGNTEKVPLKRDLADLGYYLNHINPSRPLRQLAEEETN